MQFLPMSPVTLYCKHNTGGVGTWRVWHDGVRRIYVAHATVEGGQEVVHQEEVTTNASGRSIEEQIDLRMRSRIKRQTDKGYCFIREEALQGKTNQLGCPLPMLAQKLKDVKNPNLEGAVLQLKLNGHRIVATKQDGEILLYSRKGNRIRLPHIEEWLESRLPEGVFLDGEGYVHGVKLQTIGSWIKKEQPESRQIKFYVFDLISEDDYVDRHAEAGDILGETTSADPVMLLPYFLWKGEEFEAQLFNATRRSGYEGLMRKLAGFPYEAGKRSSGTIKVKQFDDCEVTVKDIILSPRGVVVCKCETSDGKPVDVTAPGKVAEKEAIYAARADYIGKPLTISYAELTADGIPFHPVVQQFREDV